MPRPPIPLRYAEHGDRSAAPVVLLHGFPLNGAMWDEVVSALSDRYRVVVPDLRGHGATEAPNGPYETVDYAADVVVLLDELGIEQTAVVGLSMGGYVAIQLMTRWPERLTAVVLADTMGHGDSEERKQARAAQAAVIEQDGLGPFADLVMPRMFAPAVFADRPQLVERFRQTILSQRPHAVIAALQGLASRPDMLGPLAEVRLPTLVLVGSEDAATTPDDARELARVIHDAELVVVEGAGHMSCWEDPNAFNAAVRDFLDRTVEPTK
ncbi:MAG: alpha/beta fold hydrolase [Chloroflexota bacterium]